MSPDLGPPPAAGDTPRHQFVAKQPRPRPSGGETIGVDLLGSLRLRVGGVDVPVGPPRQRAVLGFLTVNRGRTVSRDDVIDAVWGDAAPVSATRNVQTYVSDLRRRMTSADVLVTVGSGYRLDLADDAVDECRLTRLIASAGTAEPGAAPQLWRSALDLWRGRPLADVDAPFADVERTRLDNVRLVAVTGLAEALLRCGRANETATVLAPEITEHPLNERLAELLMRALDALGRGSEALRVYARLRSALTERLGLEPGMATTALRDRIADSPHVDARPPVTPVGLPGRRPLLGREAELDELTARVERHLVRQPTGRPLILTIDGTAGVGKTALAVELVEQVRRWFPDGCYRVDLGTVPAEEVLTEVSRVVGGYTEPHEANPEERAAMFRSQVAGRRAVLLLDDVAHPDHVRPLLPNSPEWLVVVTGRARLGGLVARDGAFRLGLRPLPPEAAATLAGHGQDGAEIAEICDRLPLALVAAARHSDPLPGLRDPATRLATLGTPLRTSLERSLSVLTPHAATRFVLLGLHPVVRVRPQSAAPLFGVTVPTARRLLDEFANAGLLDWDEAESYLLSRLSHDYAAERAAELPEPVRSAALHRLYAALRTGPSSFTEALRPPTPE